MNEQASSSPDPRTPPSDRISRRALVVLLLITIVALGAVLWLFLVKGAPAPEVIVGTVSTEPTPVAEDVYTSQVIDAMDRRDVTAEEGHRYKVLIEDESKEGSAGVTHIGGLVTFVQGAQPGEIVIVEITRMKRSTAEAKLIKRVGMGEVRPRRDTRREERPEAARGSQAGLEVGKVYRATVTDLGRMGDGLVRINGKVVFVPGASVGEEISVRIVEDGARIAKGERVAADAAVTGTSETVAPAPPPPASAAAAAGSTDSLSATADDVQPGREFDVVVSEKDRKTPDQNGVARINGLVIFVPNSQPGDQVRIRITERLPRFAFSEVLENRGPIQLKE